MAGERIVIAEDDADLVSALAERLQAAGYEVIHTADGAQAVSLIEGVKPAVAFVDVHLPGRSGLEVCAEVRRALWGRKIPLVVLTASADRKAVEEAVKLGVSGCLLKPFRAEDFMAEVRKHLGVPEQEEEGAAPKEGKVGPMLAKVLEQVATLPPVPMTTQRLLDVLNNPSAGAKDLGKVILTDPAVTAQVLKIANSAYYGQQGKVSDVTKAVILIGFAEISHTLMALSLSNLFVRKDGKEVLDRVAFWEHSLACSVASFHLGRHAGLPDPNQAMVAGLLHDLGKLVMAFYLPVEYGGVLKRAASERRHTRDVEREAFGENHSLIGQALAERWKLPVPIHRCIRHHHSPLAVESLDHGTISLVRVVSTADALVKAGGIGRAGDDLVEDPPERVLSLLMVDQKAATNALAAARQTVTVHKHAVGGAPPSEIKPAKVPVVLLYEGSQSVALSAFAVEAVGGTPALCWSWGDAMKALSVEDQPPGILVVDGAGAPSQSRFLETALRWRGTRTSPQVLYLGPGRFLTDLPMLPALKGCPKPLSLDALKKVLFPKG